MKKLLLTAACAAALTLPVQAQTEAPTEPVGAPSPNEIVALAAPEEWLTIPAEDLLVMTLAPDAAGKEREVIIQLMPAPFSQGWVENIRTLARAKWYDGITVNRVQDNYVVQWGDAGHDNPESGETETKPLPEGLKVMGEDDYVEETFVMEGATDKEYLYWRALLVGLWASGTDDDVIETLPPMAQADARKAALADRYSGVTSYSRGWAFAGKPGEVWPVHCYGMVGVGRSYSPDTGSGAELYTVIGHAPRHLDRNIALAGRIISGIEHLSSLPRGSGALGFYTDDEKELRTPILSVRVASDLPGAEQPRFEYLSTESHSFGEYAKSRANRRDPFFIQPASGADICNIPVPIRDVELEAP
ncbi:MAG: peptidylprolyl isomerase [Erythrobacter sp.]